jgi:hypothetical protein
MHEFFLMREGNGRPTGVAHTPLLQYFQRIFSLTCKWSIAILQVRPSFASLSFLLCVSSQDHSRRMSQVIARYSYFAGIYSYIDAGDQLYGEHPCNFIFRYGTAPAMFVIATASLLPPWIGDRYMYQGRRLCTRILDDALLDSDSITATDPTNIAGGLKCDH